MDDPGFDLILLLLGLAAGSSRFASFGIRALAPIQVGILNLIQFLKSMIISGLGKSIDLTLAIELLSFLGTLRRKSRENKKARVQQLERMNVMVDLIYDRLERRDNRIEQLLDGYDEASGSSSCKLKWGSSTKKEEKIALKPIKEKSINKFQPNGKKNGHIASQFLDNDGRNATLLPLPPNQMEEEQLQIKWPIGEKSEEFKNVFLEQMPPKKSPIKSVVIDSMTNLFEKRGNGMIQLEDPSHGLEEESQDDGSAGQYSLSLKPSLDDPGFDLILLLLGLAAGILCIMFSTNGQSFTSFLV
ncbi:hypothetical protein CRG98_031738 [Punica granatum]|uniref:Uncharacterized protein n=1 Tax=Punica granatum TaxID=22663 RepID=A0A2I0IV52_PUNGR|nr:hypothetical protein CRG98_031738 [Punica granatum]